MKINYKSSKFWHSSSAKLIFSAENYSQIKNPGFGASTAKIVLAER